LNVREKKTCRSRHRLCKFVHFHSQLNGDTWSLLDDVCLENDRYLVFFPSLFFLSKKRHLVAISWERLYVCFNALSHLFVLLLDFPFFSPARRFFLPFFSLFLHRWIIMMHIHRKTLLFFCRHKSVIDCSSSMCMCVYCLGSNCELFSVCPYSKRARASEHIFFVVNWVFTFEDGRVCVKERKRLKTIDESTLYWCLSRSFVYILLVSNHVYFIDHISNKMRL
jgi:hypothetical protein